MLLDEEIQQTRSTAWETRSSVFRTFLVLLSQEEIWFQASFSSPRIPMRETLVNCSSAGIFVFPFPHRFECKENTAVTFWNVQLFIIINDNIKSLFFYFIYFIFYCHCKAEKMFVEEGPLGSSLHFMMHRDVILVP